MCNLIMAIAFLVALITFIIYNCCDWVYIGFAIYGIIAFLLWWKVIREFNKRESKKNGKN